ncbi:MAG: prepilin peptidase [Acutalibacteraceae bacterium]|nr:prepilin peptidase [Acutalibacteraceae bacterium]
MSIVLLLVGYVSACYYLNGVKWNSKNVEVLKLTRNKIIYLCFGVIAVATLITLFQIVYNLKLISQIKLLTLVLIILPVAAIDLRLQKIPNQFMLAALVLRLVIYIPEFIISASNAFSTLKDNILGALIIGVFFILLLLIFKNSIGMGDIKLFAIMGLYQGLWGAINSVFFSLVVSFVVSVALLISRKKEKKDTISFGPSILLGTIIAIGLAGM